MDHQILELIPIYGNEKERHPATKKELEEIQEEILRQQIVPSELDGSMPSAPEKIIQKLKPRIP